MPIQFIQSQSVLVELLALLVGRMAHLEETQQYFQ
jgi:hypothetical protein